METDEFLRVLKQADHVLAAYVPEVFTEANQMLAAMMPSQVSGIRGVWLRLTNGEYKAACKRAIGLRRGAKASGTVIFRELTKAKETQEKWQELSGSDSTPKSVPETAACEDIYQTAQAEPAPSVRSATRVGMTWNFLRYCEGLCSFFRYHDAVSHSPVVRD